MRCPCCQFDYTKVLKTRLIDNCMQVCRVSAVVASKRYSTNEIIKRNNIREVFNESKLRSAIAKVLEKRPVKAKDIKLMIQYIKNSITTLC